MRGDAQAQRLGRARRPAPHQVHGDGGGGEGGGCGRPATGEHVGEGGGGPVPDGGERPVRDGPVHAGGQAPYGARGHPVRRGGRRLEQQVPQLVGGELGGVRVDGGLDGQRGQGRLKAGGSRRAGHAAGPQEQRAGGVAGLGVDAQPDRRRHERDPGRLPRVVRRVQGEVRGVRGAGRVDVRDEGVGEVVVGVGAGRYGGVGARAQPGPGGPGAGQTGRLAGARLEEADPAGVAQDRGQLPQRRRSRRARGAGARTGGGPQRVVDRAEARRQGQADGVGGQGVHGKGWGSVDSSPVSRGSPSVRRMRGPYVTVAVPGTTTLAADRPSAASSAVVWSTATTSSPVSR